MNRLSEIELRATLPLRRILLFILVILLMMVARPPIFPVSGWSIDGHMIVVHYASSMLPAPWNSIFGYYGGLLNDTTVYPDIYYRELDPAESPRHFIDLEIWNSNSPWTGTLPQSVEEFTTKMQMALEAKDWNAVFLYAGRVAHYMADATQPYHTTVNYNPMNRNGVGLHQVLDSALATHFSEFEIINPSEIGLSPIENITELALQTAIQSHSFLPAINRTLINEGLDWSPELTSIVENRTNTAITAVARVWYTALVRAAIPPPEIPHPNPLSIAVENVTLSADNLTIVRLNVTDALGVKTYADVNANLDGYVIRGLVANTIPPTGEYVIILEQVTATRSLSLTAQRSGYATGEAVVNLPGKLASTLTLSSTVGMASSAIENRIVVPFITVVGVAVMLVAFLVLIVYRRQTTGN